MSRKKKARARRNDGTTLPEEKSPVGLLVRETALATRQDHPQKRDQKYNIIFIEQTVIITGYRFELNRTENG